MQEYSFTILGSSSGFPQAGRATSGYLLKTGERYTLIDCGGGVTKSFLTTGADPLMVDRVFISHTHSDHVCELPLFIQLIYLKGRKEKFDIYLPSEFVEIFEKYLYAVYLWKERMPFKFSLIGYDAGFEYNGQFNLTAHATNHLKRYAANLGSLNIENKMQCHSFQIEVNGHKLFYSSDVDGIDDVRDHLNGNKYAIIETTHIDLPELLRAASDYEVDQFVLTHLGNEAEVEEIRQAIKEARAENMTIAEDGMVLEL